MDWERRDRLYEEQLTAHIEMVNAYRCEICSRPGQFMKLLGGRHVVLCIEHLNAWREYLMGHELGNKWNDAQADYYMAIIQRRDEETTKERGRMWQDVDDAIYELSGEWLKEETVKWHQ